MIDTDKYEGHSKMIDANEIGEIWEYLADTISEDSRERAEANYNLVADAPLLLEEVKRLGHKLMLAESALGEIRAYHENSQGNLGEIIEHYRDMEGVEMPNAFDEVIE